MRKFFKKIASYAVAAYANRLYRKAVQKAEERSAQEKTMIYVISSFFDDSQLVCCSRHEFRTVKEKLRLRHLKVDGLKAGSWYHTGDAIGRNGISPADKEARRIAFVRMLLRKANL